jgi:tetratricopeptide (TPR) repeat protein
MTDKLISCISFPPATIKSVPIYDFEMANENEELADEPMAHFYSCCGKSICSGCIYSVLSGNILSGNNDKCPFCNSNDNKAHEERVDELMKRVEANDPTSICTLADSYYHGSSGLQQDHAKAIELYVRAANLGYSKAHNQLGGIYDEGGNLKKAKFHFEAAAMAGDEVARYNLGMIESNSGNMERAVKHWTISASGGCYESMHELRTLFKQGFINRESINSTLAAYNSSCAEMRSEARDAFFQMVTKYAPREE